jgi:hypothetical protein
MDTSIQRTQCGWNSVKNSQTQTSQDNRRDREKDCKDSNIIQEKIAVAIFNMVITCPCWIHIQGIEPCIYNESYRDKKCPPKT